MEEYFQSPSPSVSSKRILYTASGWAKSNLIFLQETGSLRAIKPHVSRRENLQSYLCLIVVEGSGHIEYEGQRYEMKKGDCAFIDCMKSYSHSTGGGDGLWSLEWVHFYGENMAAVYDKYIERGGQAVFTPENADTYKQIFSRLYEIAGSEDYIRDMKLNAVLNELLAVIMEQSWHPENVSVGKKRRELIEVKAFLDEHYTEKIVLDDLAERFFINKFYMTRIFKETYGTTINNYLISRRITRAKQLLRFTDMTVDEIGNAAGMGDANYFSRMFRKVEGSSPREYRKKWSEIRKRN